MRRRLVGFVLWEQAWGFWIWPVGCELLDACGFVHMIDYGDDVGRVSLTMSFLGVLSQCPSIQEFFPSTPTSMDAVRCHANTRHR